MDVPSILTSTRLKTWLDTNTISDANALILLNEVYRELINAIKINVNEAYFYYRWTSDTNTTDNRYSLDRRTSTDPWLDKLMSVAVKYKTTDTDYFKLEPKNFTDLKYDLEWYKTNISTVEGFYLVLWNNINIFPIPEEAVTNGIRFYGISDPIDLTLTSTSAEVLVPVMYHEMLNKWLVVKFYENVQLYDKYNFAKGIYEQDKRDMIVWLKRRDLTPVEVTLPPIYN